MQAMRALGLGALLVAGLAPCAAQQQGGDGEVVPKHGFWRDPMTFARESETVHGALIRRDILGQPRPGDAALLQARIDEILAELKPDGSFAAGHSDKTLGVLRALHTHGLIDDLAALPAFPPDWRIVRSIPAPGRR